MEALPFLEDGTDREWAAVKAHSEIRRFSGGQFVARTGDPDRSLAILLSGLLEVRVPGRTALDRLVLEPGAVVGEVAFFDGAPRSSDVVSLGDVEVLRLSFEGYQALAAKEPALGQKLLLDLGRTLAQRLRATDALFRGGS